MEALISAKSGEVDIALIVDELTQAVICLRLCQREILTLSPSLSKEK